MAIGRVRKMEKERKKERERKEKFKTSTTKHEYVKTKWKVKRAGQQLIQDGRFPPTGVNEYVLSWEMHGRFAVRL